jgi:hypothetical protein
VVTAGSKESSMLDEIFIYLLLNQALRRNFHDGILHLPSPLTKATVAMAVSCRYVYQVSSLTTSVVPETGQ